MHRKLKIAIPSTVVATAVGAAMMMSSIGTSSAAKAPTPPAPAVPQVVNPDGSLNWSVLNTIPVWEPQGYTGPTVYASTVIKNQMAAANLTPAQVAAMTPAQRAAKGIAVTP